MRAARTHGPAAPLRGHVSGHVSNPEARRLRRFRKHRADWRRHGMAFYVASVGVAAELERAERANESRSIGAALDRAHTLWRTWKMQPSWLRPAEAPAEPVDAGHGVTYMQSPFSRSAASATAAQAASQHE